MDCNNVNCLFITLLYSLFSSVIGQKTAIISLILQRVHYHFWCSSDAYIKLFMFTCFKTLNTIFSVSEKVHLYGICTKVPHMCSAVSSDGDIFINVRMPLFEFNIPR